ncbi:PQQ-binding-like beta-propeller repeat protein [Nocardioides gilvus]|uniref:outer membrane protein assembly factor BamB family protein n=1 Tax=Nocardioides gilvus TaxID=1735589 RepID=UPI0013A55A1B|nr:PQQ-binding-like beta-propeller repeat protein [Nocardioides gilvus]
MTRDVGHIPAGIRVVRIVRIVRGVRVARGLGRHAVLTGAVLGTLLLTGCTNIGFGGDDPAEPSAAPATPPPTLKAEWSIAGVNSNPEAVGAHHWMAYQAMTSGMGRNMSSSTGPTLLVDARTGRTHAPMVEPERFPCLTPSQISDDGIVPIFWSTYTQDPGGSTQTESCNRVTVLDADTGKTLWRDDALDLFGLAPERAVGADERTVAVVDARGRSRCFAARTGAPQPDDEAACVDLSDRLTHADLPPLVDADGEPAPLAKPWTYAYEPAIVEIGRNDEVLLARARIDREGEMEGNRWGIRAHDLKTGETLWKDDDLTLDPHDGDAWGRDETYFVAPSGVVRVSYEHTEDIEDSSRTPMVLTAVDPQTGKDLKPIARIEGAWFNHQFGDMMVALTNQQYGMKSRISGFELPTW